MGRQWKQWETFNLEAPKSLQMVSAAMKSKDACSLEEKLDSILKSRDITLPKKVHKSESYGFSSSHVWMWELDYRKTLSTWRIHAFELWCWRRLLRVPWAARRSSQSILKVYQSWIFIGRTDFGAETPRLWLWPPDAKNWLIWKDPDAGKDWGQEEKGTTEDEMVGWHHRLDGHEFE